MIADLQPFPAYKRSGVEWLGEVPAHWEVLPNRRLFTEVKERDHPEEQMLSVTIARGVIRQQELLTDSSKKDASNEDKSAYKLVRPGDIAYNKMRAWQGAVGTSDYQGIISPAYVVQRPREGADSRYLHYLLRTPRFAKEAERWSYGITSDMWSLRPEHFKMIYVSLPPLPEQTAIVRYLDHADGRIQRYLRGKQKLIKLLEEQKQAVIHRAVTRGLDPDVRLKPSGVEWLGDVPAHWEVMALKRLGHFSSGAGFPIQDQGQQNLELPFFKVSDMNLPNNDRVMTVWNNSVSHMIAARLGANVFPTGTIVFPKVGGALLTNKRRVVERPCCIDNNLMGCIVRRGDPQFTLLLMEHLDLATIAKPGPVPAISESEIREIRAVFPSLPEQTAIVEFLDKATANMNVAIDRTRRQIDLLREYRTRLIADVVTGKLDVCEATAQLPDEADEPSAMEIVDDYAD